MIALMVYASVVGAFVAVAARALEVVARWAGHPSRWVWSGAIALSVALGARAAVRPPRAAPVELTSEFSSPILRAAGGTSSEWQSVIRVAAGVIDEALDSPASIQAVLTRKLPLLTNAYAAVAWAAASLVLGFVFIGVYRRLLRARARWPLAVVHGVPVRIAADIGPIVVGVARAEIVVPKWLMDRTADDQRLVVEHERSHIRAGDPLHIALACAATILVPWHVPLWYMVSRLRLCVELDCDARVLSAGASSAAYGALLIDVAERVTPMRLSALALTDDSSQLERRILAMNLRRPSFVLARGAIIAVFALVTLVAACETALPTTTQVAPAPAQNSTREPIRTARVESLPPRYYVGNVEVTRFWVDGKQVGVGDVLKIDTLRLASMNVRKDPDGQSSVLITLKPELRIVRKPYRQVLGSNGHIAFFIDGVESDSTGLARVSKDSILSIEVLKGEYMRTQYPGKDYTGVVLVRTKSAKPD